MKFAGNSFRTLSIAIIIISLVAAAYFYVQYQKSQKLLQNPTLAVQEEVKTLVTRVSGLMELPKNEQPTIATISDKSKLKDQPFFVQAQNGDKLLIYTNAKKAIIYRPSTNKIIEVGPVNIGPSTSVSSTSSISKEISVALYNGTSIVGLTNTAEKDLKSKLDNISIVKKENAAKNDYEKTVVVALSKAKEQEAKTIAEFLGTQVSLLPEGEVKPEADILIILGSDYTKR